MIQLYKSMGWVHNKTKLNFSYAKNTASSRAFKSSRSSMGLRNHYLKRRLPIGVTHLFIIPNTENLSFALPIPIWLGCLSIWNICNASRAAESTFKNLFLDVSVTAHNLKT
nr:hypothetical protein Iba_chr04fCG12770 [Ipomoea batatas]